MRDLTTIELGHVYGAGGKGCSPCAPSKPPKGGSKGRSKGKGGSKGRSKAKGGSKKGGSKGNYCG